MSAGGYIYENGGAGVNNMSIEVVTGNHAAGYALSVAGEANRTGRGAVCGIYPITPQTEIVERVANFEFTKGHVVAVESEHSAMGVCIGASLNGARSFTASSSNGLAYMAENILVAGFYRLPIVMVAVNRTLGPPWNIWADQGDTLMFRDAAWIQFYCENNQDVVDSVLLGFRLAEDHRVLIPVMVIMDAFIISHTSMETDLPSQELVDKYLPPLDLPQRISVERPVTIGGLTWPLETASTRVEIDQAMQRVPEIFEEKRREFEKVFGRKISGAIESYQTDDAEMVLVASGSIATTARKIVEERRKNGEKIGLVKIKMFRPFPEMQLFEATQTTAKIAVLDRNYAAGTGGIFWQEVRAAMQRKPETLIQNYLTGVGGMDVTPQIINEVIEDIRGRSEVAHPVWKGVAV
jgi:pyruvate/2-oxoacid:ferredoxin oxidoreductase alpha subunit